MKSITSNLLKFTLSFAIGSILFRYGLTWAISNHKETWIWIFAVAYFILNFSLGSYFGKKDYQSFPLSDIGFRFHLVTYMVFNITWELWFLLGLQSHVEDVTLVHLIALFWGIFLLIHFILFLYNRKNTIKGLNKSDIFE